jgi:Transposase DDE domain
MTQMIAEALPGRDIRVVADSAYAGGELKKLPARVTWTTRLRKDAALHALPPARTGRRGRPRTKGNRLPFLDGLAATAAFTPVAVTRYGKTTVISAAAITCLWPSVSGTRPVTVVLIRDRSTTGYDLALVTTDTAASAAQVIERYASRWSIEAAIEDARQVFGAGQARNRTARAVERTVPFQLACQAIATCWYATAGHDSADVADHRARAPGTPARPSRRPPTWPPSSAASSSPTDLRHLAPTSQHPKKSASSAWPGKTSPHNYESRVTCQNELY